MSNHLLTVLLLFLQKLEFPLVLQLAEFLRRRDWRMWLGRFIDLAHGGELCG